MGKLSDRVAIVTGAGTGIGKAIAIAFAREGARVIAAGRRIERLQETSAQIREEGGDCLAVPCDVSRSADVRELVERGAGHFGRLDLLINNAGVLVLRPTLQTDEGDFDRTIAINLKGVYLCSRAVAPHLIRQRWGRIINIVAGVSVRPTAQGAYSASKAGALALTKSLALELGPHGVTVNAINPGPIATDMTLPGWSNPESRAQTMARAVVGRFAEPEEVARGALYFADPDNGFVTGAVLAIDGGWALT